MKVLIVGGVAGGAGTAAGGVRTSAGRRRLLPSGRLRPAYRAAAGAAVRGMKRGFQIKYRRPRGGAGIFLIFSGKAACASSLRLGGLSAA